MQLQRNQNGFTIIELMIATSVLSVILVLVTILMMSIGNLYYKGVNQARTQDNVRSISDELGQQLQLSSQPPAESDSAASTNKFSDLVVHAYCVGTTRYSYVTGVAVDTTFAGGDGHPLPGDNLRHVLWRDTIPSGAECVAADLTASTPKDKSGNGANGTELIAPRSRLTQFCIGTIDPTNHLCTTNTDSPYSIEVGVAYGDYDLLKDAGPPSFSDLAKNLNFPNALCKGGTGDRFCATAYLHTTVVKRLTNDSL
jgi:prepilin-type N-terminal cleavage/methylation domain-containing protein